MKKIIVTEKPSVAREFVKALGITAPSQAGYYEDDNWIVTWCVGHLIEMAYPEVYDEAYKKWDIDLLPFLPEHYIYEPIADVKDQFYTIKELYNRRDVDTIYYAGDPAREGIYIQMLVRQEAGHTPGINELVVWIDSQTKEEILRGIKEAKPLSAYKNLSDSGYMRAIEDYAFGINFTRLLTTKYGRVVNAASGGNHKGSLAVGRVMTCVLGMVVNREHEILNFVPTPFFKIKAVMYPGTGNVELQWKSVEGSRVFNSPDLYNETGFKTEEKAKAFITSLPASLTVTSLEKKTEKHNAPLLYNLAELQADCSKKLKISPNETLNIAQSLYEKKLTTYPRTDARVLSSAVAKVISDNIEGLAVIPEYSDAVGNILDSGTYKDIADTRYTDDKKIADHYALIPTGYTDGYKDLSELERSVYDMIIRRFLSIFMPPAEYMKVKVTAKGDTESFFTTVSKLMKPGYKSLYGSGDDDEDAAPEAWDAVNALTQGSAYSSTYDTVRGETKPPKRYTSGSMILAMENAGNLIEDEELREQIKSNGIGTSATRAATIDKLVNGGYLKLNKKTQVLTPEKYGEMVYIVVKLTMPELLSPEMTANWEKDLDEIVTGKVTRQEYQDKLYSYIRNKCEDLKESDFTDDIVEDIRPYAEDKNFTKEDALKEREKYTGTVAATGEEVTFNREWGGHRFTDDEIEKLLNGEMIEITAISKKDGSEHQVKGTLEKQEYNKHEFWGFKMDDSCPPDKVEGLYKGKNKVRFKKEWGGHEFTPDEIDKLLAGETIEITATSKKDGSQHQVRGALAQQTYNSHKFWGFKIDDTCPPDKVEGMYGKTKVRFKKEWGGHEFTPDEVKQLLAGETIEITATSKKDGSKHQVKGSLQKQEYNGHKFWGFKMDSTCPPDKVEGMYKDKTKVRFKRTWGPQDHQHEFTDQEIKDLLDGKEITFPAVSKSGTQYNVKGSLKQQEYNGHRFWGFQADFGNKKKR